MRPLTFSRPLALAVSCTFFAAAAQAQSLEIVGKSGDYQISRVAASNVCFAVLNLASDNGADASYATFETLGGDRWQVAGYVDDDAVSLAEDDLQITFDGTVQLRRTVEFSKGDFVLPFTSDEELSGFDSYVKNATEMKLNLIKQGDAVTVELDGLRAARAALGTCLEALK